MRKIILLICFILTLSVAKAEQPYVGEIKMFAGNFAPTGWAFCHGQLLPIAENETLFELIGTTYGGDGQNNFALPDFRGRIPVHQGTLNGITKTIGETGGTETVTMKVNQMPVHNHLVFVSSSKASGNAAISLKNADGSNVKSAFTTVVTNPATPITVLHNSTIGETGTAQPIDIAQPATAINYIISLYGVFPTQ